MIPDSIKRLTDPPDHHFFGYYDKCPWDGSGRYILSLSTDFANRLPEPPDEARVQILDTKQEVPQDVATTKAWNFQTGSMLQWCGEDNTQFVFNDRDGNRFVARLHDRGGSHIRTYDQPIYACSPGGTRAVTLNFARLYQARPGYGYPTESSGKTINAAPENDGLFAIDLRSGESELLISLQELSEIDLPKSAAEQLHWINHLSFSPDGSRVAFLHRWALSGSGMYTRLFTYNFETGDLKCVIDSGKVTHYDWRNQRELVAWSRRSSAISKSAKIGVFDLPVIQYFVDLYRSLNVPSIVSEGIVGDRYHHYDLETGQVKQMDGVPDRDGHPSVSDDGRWLVTDTYPDKNSHRHLYLCDVVKGDFMELAEFSSSAKHDGTAYRCDLHPRWNRDDTAVCIDSMHQGTRQMYVIDVSQYIK